MLTGFLSFVPGPQPEKRIAMEEKMKEIQSPNWIVWDSKKKELTIKEGTVTEKADLLFDLGQVIEFYQR